MDLFKNSESDPLFGKQFQGLLPAPWPTCTVAIISLTVLSLGVGCTYRMLRRRRRKRAKLATMTASRQECGTREYVEDAIREAFVLVGVFNACTPSQLPNVLEVAMGRSPSEQETSAVLAACSHSGQTAFTPSIVCDAFLATKDSALVSAAVRTQRDHDFMRAHHGRTHRQVLRSMLCSVWYFSLLNVLLLPASLLALLYALLEVATSDGAYLGASGFAAGAAICLLMSAVGIRAMCLVRGDLRRADDGRTRAAQHTHTAPRTRTGKQQRHTRHRGARAQAAHAGVGARRAAGEGGAANATFGSSLTSMCESFRDLAVPRVAVGSSRSYSTSL